MRGNISSHVEHDVEVDRDGCLAQAKEASRQVRRYRRKNSSKRNARADTHHGLLFENTLARVTLTLRPQQKHKYDLEQEYLGNVDGQLQITGLCKLGNRLPHLLLPQRAPQGSRRRREEIGDLLQGSECLLGLRFLESLDDQPDKQVLTS